MSAPATSDGVVPDFFANLGIVERPVEKNDQFQILGDFCQIVHMKLESQQSIQVEPGVMCYMSEKCKESVKLAGFGRMLMEGTLTKGAYQNQDSAPGYIGLTSNLPGNIVPINLDLMGGAVKAKKDAFMAAFDSGAQIKLSRIASSSIAGCCFSDVPYFMMEIRAKGWVFLSAHGTIMQKELKAGESIIVEGDSLVACSTTVKCDAVFSGSCGTMCCGGEGFFNTALEGPGLVILASLPIDKLRKLFPRPAPTPKSTAEKGVNSAK